MANEKRMIDANALMAYIHNHDYELVSRMGCVDKGMFTDGIEHGINIQKTVDAVEVVRCGKCRFCKEHPTSDKVKMCTNENWNTEYYPLVHDNDFCSLGERRTDG